MQFSVAQSAAFVLLVWFLAYVVAIAYPFLTRRPVAPGRAAPYDVHVFIPCLDEEEVIEATIARIRSSFGDLHVWVIDDDSADGTRDRVARLARDDGHLHLIERRAPFARQGKGEALNAAYRALDRHLAARGDPVDRDLVIVAVLDADGALDHDALTTLASASVFGDPAIGAAQVRVAITNCDLARVPHAGAADRLRNAAARWLLRCQDIEFQTSIAAQQTLRLATGSAGLGGNGQFTRLAVLDRVQAEYGGPWHGSLLEDYELGIHTILVGARTTYVHDTAVRQQALPTLRPFLRQRTRWAQGGMQCVRYLPRVARSRHFTNAGVLETAYFLLAPWVGVVGLLLWPLVAVSVLTYAVDVYGGIGAWLVAAWWIWPLFALTGIAPFAFWAFVYRRRYRPEATRRTALKWGLGYWIYLYLTHIVLLRAAARLAAGLTSWDKTDHRAEPEIDPVPAAARHEGTT